jgi:hypothetical protein
MPSPDRFRVARIVAEKLAAAFTSTSSVALANADVARPKKTIARSIGPSYQTQSAAAKYRSDLRKSWLALGTRPATVKNRGKIAAIEQKPGACVSRIAKRK